MGGRYPIDRPPLWPLVPLESISTSRTGGWPGSARIGLHEPWRRVKASAAAEPAHAGHDVVATSATMPRRFAPPTPHPTPPFVGGGRDEFGRTTGGSVRRWVVFAVRYLGRSAMAAGCWRVDGRLRWLPGVGHEMQMGAGKVVGWAARSRSSQRAAAAAASSSVVSSPSSAVWWWRAVSMRRMSAARATRSRQITRWNRPASEWGHGSSGRTTSRPWLESVQSGLRAQALQMCALAR